MTFVILDTETSGLNSKGKDRIIEIGCVKIVEDNGVMKMIDTFHYYINPETTIDSGAFAVHGISTQFLKDKPLFKEVVDKFLNYIEDTTLVIHNAAFDIRFLNKEMALCNKSDLKNNVIDTLKIAREKFPGAPASLDALCKRFEISILEREKHGALLDARLLAEVFIEMNKPKDAELFIEEFEFQTKIDIQNIEKQITKISISQEEIEAHKVLVSNIPNNRWK